LSRSLYAHIDSVVAASMAPASKAMAPVLRDVREALDSADRYDAADATLRRLEGKTRADGLEGVLAGAMMNGTSAGAVD
jgi:hypothetical protein